MSSDGVRGDGVRGDGVRGDGVRGDGVSGDGVNGNGLEFHSNIFTRVHLLVRQYLPRGRRSSQTLPPSTAPWSQALYGSCPLPLKWLPPACF